MAWLPAQVAGHIHLCYRRSDAPRLASGASRPLRPLSTLHLIYKHEEPLRHNPFAAHSHDAKLRARFSSYNQAMPCS
jgi:hypothetical protein